MTIVTYEIGTIGGQLFLENLRNQKNYHFYRHVQQFIEKS